MATTFQQFYDERKYSLITEEFPDKTKFPLYYQTRKREFIIDEGEMLFIPAGWWHFVFSEEVNPKTKINYAMNFWYEEPFNWKEGITDPLYVPKIKNHNIQSKDPSEFLKDYNLLIHRSKMKYFPPDILKHRYSQVSTEYMTYDEFKMTENPEYYILQNRCTEIDKYAPRFERPLFQSSIWVNFGNIYSLPHYDMKDNWLCQLQGKKRVLLFPPDDRDNMYPMNNHSLGLLSEMEFKVQGDIFIRRNRFSIEPKICNHVVDLLPINTLDNPTLQESFLRESKALENYFGQMQCAIPKFPVVETFHVKDVRGSFYEQGQFDTPCIFLWFMTNGRLLIRNFNFQVLQGQLFIFPASFLYPWKVENAVFIFPNFRRPIQDT